MNPTVTLERADRVPHDARVRDYDELEADAQHAFPSTPDDAATIDVDSTNVFEDGEIVKYTGYYRITVAE